MPCDTGTDISVLEKEMAGKPVDLSRVEAGWNSKKGRWAPTADAIGTRAREVRQWLKARPEKDIVLVTHGGFLHYLTEDWADYNKIMGKVLPWKIESAVGFTDSSQARDGRTSSTAPTSSLTKMARMPLW